MDVHKIFKQTKHPTDVVDYYHTYNLPNVLGDVYWLRLFDQIQSVEGDLVECGVGRGRSLITLLSLNLYFKMTGGISRCMYALDSFQGFPEPTKEDKSRRNPKKVDWSQSPNGNFEYSIENLFKILTFAGLNVPFFRESDSSYLTNGANLKIVKGFFDETTCNLSTEKIALLHLDGDLYNSVKIPLANLASKISIGGIVVVDDFQVGDEMSEDEAFPGARTAINEFLLRHDNFVMKESIRGTPVLVKMR
jgi:hypothetical protein